MQKEWSTEELKELARQLGGPDGENGIKIASHMAVGNANMTMRSINNLGIANGDRILEIGPGNASHLAQIFQQANRLQYTAIDISETMIVEATRLNQLFVDSGDAAFAISNGQNLLFDDHYFDKILTVNTLYFWSQPEVLAAEIYRVLKPGGFFVLTIAAKSSMEKMPFTKFGFKLYDRSDAENLLINAKFHIELVSEEVDVTTGNMGQAIERDIIIIKASKV